jgi:F-type H+-transporting ATPase subunit epsilon
MSGFNVEIVTPAGIVFTGDVDSCTAPGTTGQFQILKNHAPFLSNLVIGAIKIEKPEGAEMLATSGGFLEVNDNKVSIIAETAEFADKIDVKRAEEAEKRARAKLSEKEDIDIERAKLALFRALNRLKIASKI